MSCRLSNARTAAAFTLMEMLLALGVSAIVLAGIGGVFFSAMRLRERTVAMLDESAPLHQALAFLRRDLRGALPPGAGLASIFRSGALSSGSGRGMSIEFATTTGRLSPTAPWGDVQEVYYELRDPVRRIGAGRDLVRGVIRNLLGTVSQDVEEQVLLPNVQSLEFLCYDGLNWRDIWDSSLGDTNLPSAVRVRIQMATDAQTSGVRPEPIEMVIPLIVAPQTNQVQTAGGAL